MKKKINSEAGFTLIEMLAVAVVLVFLGLMVTTGMQMAFKSYRDVTAQSEVELLLSTAVDALADDLRFARTVVPSTSNPDVPFTYFSDSFGDGTQLKVVNGQIMVYTNDAPIKPKRFLSTGAYGLKVADNEWTYKVKTMTIDCQADNTFKITLTVMTADEKISASTEVTVRCLNPIT